MLRKIVILSFLGTLLWTVVTVISISQIDPSLTPFGVGPSVVTSKPANGGHPKTGQ